MMFAKNKWMLAAIGCIALWQSEFVAAGCSYLTKSAVEAEGGRLNSHEVGNIVCYQGRVKECDSYGEWIDKGLCEKFYRPVTPVEKLEGTQQDARIIESDGSSEPSDGDNESGSPLLGGLPGEADLDKREADLNRNVQRYKEDMQTVDNDLTPTAATRSQPIFKSNGATTRAAIANSASSNSSGASCAQLSQALAETDENIRRAENAINHGFGDRNLLTTLRAYRSQIQNQIAKCGNAGGPREMRNNGSDSSPSYVPTPANGGILPANPPIQTRGGSMDMTKGGHDSSVGTSNHSKSNATTSSHGQNQR